MIDIVFTNEHPSITFNEEVLLTQKLKAVFTEEAFDKEVFLNIVFLDDDDLLSINKEYLNHDYYTDIITFPIEETEESLEADIYISLDRVGDNATSFKVTYKDELLRVVLHGALHLCGYTDKSQEEQSLMREKESFYMSF